jgi:hypothetical protein
MQLTADGCRRLDEYTKMSSRNDLKKGCGRPPRVPYIEPAVYFARHDTETAYFRVIDYLLENDATLADPVIIGDVGDPDGMSDLKWNLFKKST